MSRFLSAVGRFWIDFLIGDDPKIAAGVVVVLVAGGLVVHHGGYDADILSVLLGLALALTFTIALVVDIRRTRR